MSLHIAGAMSGTVEAARSAAAAVDPQRIRVVDTHKVSIGAGLLLAKVAPECQDILAWPGKAGIAMGVRPLGKGKVITMGTAMPGGVPAPGVA